MDFYFDLGISNAVSTNLVSPVVCTVINQEPFPIATAFPCLVADCQQDGTEQVAFIYVSSM